MQYLNTNFRFKLFKRQNTYFQKLLDPPGSSYFYCVFIIEMMLEVS